MVLKFLQSPDYSDSVPFIKIQSLGNDFVLIHKDGFNRLCHTSLQKECVYTMANRHLGVGFDQLIVIDAIDFDTLSTATIRFFNADGSIAQMCGNGTRAMGMCMLMSNPHLDCVHIAIGKTTLNVTSCPSPFDHNEKLYAVDFAPPTIKAYHFNTIEDPILKAFKGYHVHIGNDHLVIDTTDCFKDTVDNQQDFLKSLYHLAQTYGPLFQDPTFFKDGINVEFCIRHYAQNTLSMVVYERGSAITLACGSGAAAASAVFMKKTEKLFIHQPGGIVISTQNDSGILTQAGDARIVYFGFFPHTNARVCPPSSSKHACSTRPTD